MKRKSIIVKKQLSRFMENKIIEQCLALLSKIKRPILIVKHPSGQLKAYLIESIRFKTRDVFFHEVEGAQDITILVSNLPFTFVNNLLNSNATQSTIQSIELRIQNLPKIDFQFGGEDFILLKDIRENIY